MVNISNKYADFFNRFDFHLRELLKGASKALLLKVVAAVVTFLFSVVLVRVVGAKDSGVYFLSLTVVTIMATLSCVGMNIPLVRVIATSSISKNWTEVNSIYKKAILLGAIVSFTLSFTLFFSANWVANYIFEEPFLENILKIMSVAILPYSLSILHSNSLRGRKQIASSMFILNVSTPMMTLIGTIIFAKFMGITGVAWSYVVASYITIIIGRWKWVSKRHPSQKRKSYKTTTLLHSSLPIFWVDFFQIFIVRFSVLIVGVYETSDKVSLFSIANRTAILISFILVAVNSIAAPKIAELYRQKKMGELKTLIQNASKLMTAIALVPLLLFIFIPHVIMGLFSPEFVKGAYILTIMGIGQFITVSTGTVGLLLTMTGNERTWRNIILFSAIVSIVLHIILVPAYGVFGAAFAQSITIVLQMMTAVWVVWRKFKILTFPVGKPYFRFAISNNN